MNYSLKLEFMATPYFLRGVHAVNPNEESGLLLEYFREFSLPLRSPLP